MLQKIFNKVAHKMSKTMMIAILAMFATGAVNAQIRVAVLDFQAGAGISQNDVDGISDILVTYLGNDARFTLVERTQVQRVLREQGLQHSNITDSDAVRLGRILNVNKVVLGRVIVVGGQHNMDCRVVDVQTGRIVATAGNSWTPATFRSVLRSIAQSLSSGMIAFEQAERERTGVVINGVRWATRNVDSPGAFAQNPESAGMFFQWSRRRAWPSTGANVSGWCRFNNSETSWSRADDPCPQGWRVPTTSELQSLVDAGSIWTTRNGVVGRLFGSAPNQIFLPAVGLRIYHNGTLLYVGTYGFYWSSTEGFPPPGALGLFFDNSQIFANEYFYYRTNALPIRCVAQ